MCKFAGRDAVVAVFLAFAFDIQMVLGNNDWKHLEEHARGQHASHCDRAVGRKFQNTEQP